MKDMTELLELKRMIEQNESKQIYVSPAVKELVAEFISLREEFTTYRAFVVSTLTHEAHLAAGAGLLTSPERLRELAKLLEEA